ncbi:MAG: GMC family oxidoreductase N-terminal domain-containing protein [Gammaproteobacteria bacterium]
MVQAGLHDLQPALLKPYFEQVEAMLQVQPADPHYVGAIGDVIGQGARALGFQQVHPLRRNAAGCDGQGLCQFGCPTDAKQSTNVSYVPQALQAGAMLLTGIRAEQLLWDNRQIRGVQGSGIDDNGLRKTVSIKAAHVVVAMGTFLRRCSCSATASITTGWGATCRCIPVARSPVITPIAPSIMPTGFPRVLVLRIWRTRAFCLKVARRRLPPMV